MVFQIIIFIIIQNIKLIWQRNMKRKINEIIIHCTDTEYWKPVTIDDLYKWHVKERGFKDIGYHYLVHQDGSIDTCRPLSETGAHCKGHNAHSIGICYVGGRYKGEYYDTRSPLQRVMLLHLIERLCNDYPITSIKGHRDFSRKVCPCFDAEKEYSNLIKKLL